jgi:hypothetical protein
LVYLLKLNLHISPFFQKAYLASTSLERFSILRGGLLYDAKQFCLLLKYFLKNFKQGRNIFFSNVKKLLKKFKKRSFFFCGLKIFKIKKKRKISIFFEKSNVYFFKNFYNSLKMKNKNFFPAKLLHFLW